MSLSTIPLHRLVQSRSNARQTGRNLRLNELIASIRSHGLRQNLNVWSITGGRFEVVAGGRRLLALKQLARSGALPVDHPVPCQLLTTTDDPLEVSLTENAVREPMHADDQCTAFATLVAAGSSNEDIAARFGVTVAVVRQRLKLAAVSPALRTLYRKNELTLAQMMAFALVDNHGVQNAAWAELPTWHNGPDAIRRVLTRATVPATHRLARFVGLDTYIAAGGGVVRDLFGTPDECYLVDGHLLEHLATAQLTRAADEVRLEGWSWVTIEPDADWSTTRYERVLPSSNTDGSSVFSSAELARAGARLSVDPDGSLRIDRGLVQPDTVSAVRRRSSTTHAGKAARDTLPAKLTEELSAHRTAALRLMLADRPDLALAATVHALALGILYNRTNGVASCLALTGESVPLETHVQDSADGLAHHPLADLHATWLARLPPDPNDLWAWCVAQDQTLLLELLAFIAGLSVDAVATRSRPTGTPSLQHAGQLANALALDMTQWWRPSVDGFGRRVSKPALAAALTTIGQDGLATRVRAAAKLAATRLAIPALAAAGWLPAPPFIVTGTSAGGETKAERSDARSAYATALEMQQAHYSDVSATSPEGKVCTLEDLAYLARQEGVASDERSTGGETSPPSN